MRTVLVNLRVSPEERQEWKAVAGERRLSAWLRGLAGAAVAEREAVRGDGLASGSGGEVGCPRVSGTRAPQPSSRSRSATAVPLKRGGVGEEGRAKAPVGAPAAGPPPEPTVVDSSSAAVVARALAAVEAKSAPAKKRVCGAYAARGTKCKVCGEVH